MLAYVELKPYRHRLTSTLQIISLGQIMLTYMTALMLFETQEERQLLQQHRSGSGGTSPGSASGVLLVSVNCLSFGLLIWVVLTHIQTSTREASRLDQLRFADGTPVDLRPVGEAGGGLRYHIFLSHVWRSGQDQCGTIKSALRLLLPAIRVFLGMHCTLPTHCLAAQRRAPLPTASHCANPRPLCRQRRRC